MKRLELQRIYEDDRTLGRLKFGDFKCCSIELPWKDNKTDESCIPPGLYECEKYDSSQFKTECISVKNVVGRTVIAIHPANYTRQLLGCIAPGTYFKDIDNDGTLDVASSGNALKALLKVLPSKFQLFIKN